MIDLTNDFISAALTYLRLANPATGVHARRNILPRLSCRMELEGVVLEEI